MKKLLTSLVVAVCLCSTSQADILIGSVIGEFYPVGQEGPWTWAVQRNPVARLEFTTDERWYIGWEHTWTPEDEGWEPFTDIINSNDLDYWLTFSLDRRELLMYTAWSWLNKVEDHYRPSDFDYTRIRVSIPPTLPPNPAYVDSVWELYGNYRDGVEQPRVPEPSALTLLGYMIVLAATSRVRI